MKFNKSVLILYTSPIQAFEDLKRFCEVKGACYNTFKQKKFPMVFEKTLLTKEKKGESFEYIERNGELIRIL